MPKNKILTYAGLGSASLLASLPVLFTLSPVFSSPSASAVEELKVDATGNIGAKVAPGLAITAQPVSISAYPVIGNTFVTSRATVNIINNASSGGYHLTMSSNNDGALKYGDKSINTFTGYSETGKQMKEANNPSWGYTLENVAGTNSKQATDNESDLFKTYYPIPTSSTFWSNNGDQTSSRYGYLANTYGFTNRSDGDDIEIAYAFSIGPSTVAGNYTDTITYTVYPNEPFTEATIFNLTYMQDLSIYPDACKNTPTPSITAIEDMTILDNTLPTNAASVPTVVLRDTRDGSSYTVKKLADGNCWMSSNLKLSDYTLTSNDSHVTSDHYLPASVASGFGSDGSGVYIDDTYGGYYTYATATVNSKESGYGGAPEDICPKGWRLPTEAEYSHGLRNKYGWTDDTSWTTAPFNGTLAGYYLSTGRGGLGGYGAYWSSFSHDDSSAYSLYYQSSDSSAGTHYANKKSGYSIRCIVGA